MVSELIGVQSRDYRASNSSVIVCESEKWNFEHNSDHKQTKLLTRSPYSVFGK